MASGIYERFKANLMNKEVDLDTDEIHVSLLDSNHSFTSTHNDWTDVEANEISGTGYTASGATLANTAVTQGNVTKWDADDVAWTTATFTANHAVIHDKTNAGNLIASIDFGGAQQVTSGTFTIQWHGSGIITLT